MAKAALITGASAGLGEEFAWLFATDKHDVVLVARRREKLQALADDLTKAHGVNAYVVTADLTHPDAPANISAELARLGVEVEFLVNNAGFGTSGPFAELDIGRELAMVQVNISALMQLTRLFVPAMVARGRGRVLNIGSTAGFQPGPFMAAYYASKAFVNAFSEALAVELAGTGVTVTVSCPGATDTEFAQVAGNDKSALFKAGAMGSRAVAVHAYRAMMRGEVMAIPGIKNKLGLQSLRVAPRSVVRRVAARLNQA